ncbi:hypothetical protein GCM10009557_81610 [Virgisporangium ochraceum]
MAEVVNPGRISDRPELVAARAPDRPDRQDRGTAAVSGRRHFRVVVAINKDPKAPIFRTADFGVVGDLHTVLPALASEIERLTG